MSQCVREIIYGVNDNTVLPVAMNGYHLQVNGSCGLPWFIINIDQVEMLKTCGNEIPDAIQVSRTNIWSRFKEADIVFQHFSDISDQIF